MSHLDVIRKFNLAYLLAGLFFRVDETEETSDKELSISICDNLPAAVLEMTRSYMSTSDRSLSRGMTYFSCIFSEENFHHCIFGLFPEAMEHLLLTVVVQSGNSR